MLKKIEEFQSEEFHVDTRLIYGGVTCSEIRCGTDAGEFGDVEVTEKDDNGWEDHYIIDLGTGTRVEQ